MNIKKVLFCALVLAVLFIPAFTYAEDSIDILTENGIVFGDESGLRENDILQRCEFIAMINRAFAMQQKNESVTLSDVSENSWYYNDFVTAVQNGYLLGNGDMQYTPQAPVTRAEAITMIGRLAGYHESEETQFTDDYHIPAWAKGAANSLQALGIISGYPDGTFKPDNRVTRGEAFVIFANILEKRFAGGDGSSESPYIITEPYHLLNMKYDLEGCYTLESDISFLNMSFNFQAIGTEAAPFSGRLNGNGHKIIGLYTTDSSKNALFNTIGKNGRVTGLKIVCPDVFFSVCVVNNGNIDSCANTSFTGNIQHQFASEKGGIAAINNGTVSRCYNTSDILSRTDGEIVGGIVGKNNGTVRKCFNTGALKADNSAGIAGSNSGKITDCFNTGVLSGKRVRPITDSNGAGVENCTYIEKNTESIGTLVTKGSLAKIYSGVDFGFNQEAEIPVLSSIVFSGNENFEAFSGGDGSADNPYIITDMDEFAAISDFPQSCFVQMADIDMSQSEGKNGSEIIFGGTYDGMGYTLSGFKTVSLKKNAGVLFDENHGVIKNLNISDCYAVGERISVIADENYGTISDCHVKGVLAGELAAGISAINNGNIYGCSFSGQITGEEKAGGIAVINNGSVKNSLNTSAVCGEFASGIAHENNGRIEQSCFFGALISNNSAGIAHSNNADITDCYYSPGATSSRENIGRISAVTRDAEQRAVEGNFSKLKFGSEWRMLRNSMPVPFTFAEETKRAENNTDFAGGTGSAENPFKIATAEHLYNIRKYPKESFTLLNDIDLSEACSDSGIYYNGGAGLEPIEIFEGIIFGNGYKITGLYQNNSNGGLINKNYGIISEINIEADISSNFAAVFVNENYGNILYCTAEGKLSGVKAGAFAVENSGLISECVNKAEVLASSLGAGIAAHNRAEVSNCLNTGEIKGSGDGCVILGIGGGGSISTCFNTADLYFVKGGGDFYPISDTEYKNCYYIDRYNKKFSGGFSYKQLLSSKNFEGFDFSDIWGFTSKGLPTLKSAGSPEINLKGVFGGGSGTSEDPYLISSAEEFYNIRMYSDAHFILTTDLNLSGALNSEGIMNNYGNGFESIDSFYGSLNGNGCTVYGLRYVNDDAESAGLFGALHGSVYNISFSDCRIEGKNNAGVVAGINYGKISDVTVKNSRIGTYDGASGGIAGVNRNEITGCVSSADVFSQKSSGGIAGENYGYIYLSSNKGGVIAVTQTYDGASGGIAGVNEGRIDESYNIGKAISYSESYRSYVGGIAGVNKKNILNCYNTGVYNAKGKQCYAGGIEGYGFPGSRIEGAYNSGYGSISGEGELASLAGGGEGEISFSYYEHTLPSAAGGALNTYDVYPVSAQLLASPDGTEFLPDAVWIKAGEDYKYPQLIRNTHKENESIHNVRDFAGGDGSAHNPYIIMTPEQLDNVRRYLGSAFMLMGDIDMTSYCKKNSFEPIGDNIFGFFGVFMGNGYKISGLEIHGSALFKQNHGEIYDLIVSGAAAVSTDRYCGIAEINTGLIYRCDTYTDLSVISENGNIFVGGIAGLNLSCGMIISSFAYGDVSVEAQTVHFGGVCYGNYGVIAGCSGNISASVRTSSLGIAGGISGYNYGTVSDCSAVSDTVVQGGKSASCTAGGITGVNGGNIVNCYSSSDNIAADKSGGIYGSLTSGSVINCYYNSALSNTATDANTQAFGCTEEELRQAETFKDFDFYTMWYMPENGTPGHIR